MWSLCQTKAALLYYWISHKIENSYVVFFPFFSFLQHNAKGQTLFMFTSNEIHRKTDTLFPGNNMPQLDWTSHVYFDSTCTQVATLLILL